MRGAATIPIMEGKRSTRPGNAPATPVRVGILGAGFAARFHCEGYRRVHGVQVDVVGVASRSRRRREAFAAEHGLRSFATVDELIEAVDVVDVCTPPYAHAELAARALSRGRHAVIEKPFTGAYGNGRASFRGNRAAKLQMLNAALASCDRLRAAARGTGARIFYAENWVYAPAIQKEREILSKSGGQVLWMIGEESHSGSHSPSYGVWAEAGGGSLVGKGCHPLTAALYLKQAEGEVASGTPIRPAAVSARTHELTRTPSYRDAGFLRTDYLDVEDYSQLHLVFEDGTVADIFSAEVVLGGISSWLEVRANNHRTKCSLNPIDALSTYNAREEQLADVYVVEKIGSKQGWSHPAPDEDWMNGYPQQFQDFMEAVRDDREPLCGLLLARDTVAVMYAAYVSAERRGAEFRVPRGRSVAGAAPPRGRPPA
jgi:predicted dehydrogenase